MLTKTVHASRRPGLPTPKRHGPANGAQGADALLRELYAEHGPALLRLATQLTGGDGASAEDLVQEAMLRAWRHRATTDFTAGSSRGWLTTTIRRLAIDAHRARPGPPGRSRPARVPGSCLPGPHRFRHRPLATAGGHRGWRSTTGTDRWPTPPGCCTSRRAQ